MLYLRRMKNLVLVILVALGSFSFTTAQVLTIKKVETKLLTNQGVEFVGTLIDKEKDLYLFPNWRNHGTLYINGEELAINNINFNISKNAISCELKDDKEFLFRSADILKFSINGQTFKKNGRAYFEVLVEEQSTYFYKRYDVSYSEGVTHRIGGGKVGSGKMSASYTYLVKRGNQSKTIEMNKKSVQEYFENDEDELKAYVKKNHLSYHKEEDLIKIISHMLKHSTQIS